jgi:Uracil-DNA glycosylase
MKLEDLHVEYDKLQKKYGAEELNSIYNGGCETNPDICFVFMNPTGRNIASKKEWQGIRAPWIGTKNIWILFNKVGLLNDELYDEIYSKKPNEWNEDFALKVYNNIKEKKYFINNLGKCTQIDARHLPDSVYLEYLDLLKKEIDIIKPKIIITLGNQVSSILLNQPISVSKCRKEHYEIDINKDKYKVYPVYYPIGNGRFNIDKAIEDIKYILETNNIK